MILVTGGAGFIGSVLVKMLNEDGHEDIIIVDRLGKNEKWKNLNGLKFSEFIHADELWTPEYESYLNRIDYIFHMGACSSTTERDADYLMKNNWEYSKKLFLYAAHNNLKICYASSAATYGDGRLGYSDNHKVVESLRPLNGYGYSKQIFDQWVLSQKRFPKHWVGVKFFNVFGPNEYHKEDMKSLVAKAHQQIHVEGKVKLFKSHRDGFANGEQKRDFIYVKDACRAVMDLTFKDHVESGIYNIGTGKANTFKDFISFTFKAMNRKDEIEFIDMPESLRGQYQYFTEADMTKFHSQLPDFKFMNLEDSVKDYVQNYLESEISYIGK